LNIENMPEEVLRNRYAFLDGKFVQLISAQRSTLTLGTTMNATIFSKIPLEIRVVTELDYAIWAKFGGCTQMAIFYKNNDEDENYGEYNGCDSTSNDRAEADRKSHAHAHSLGEEIAQAA